MINSIGIVGLGFVGGTVFNWFKSKNWEVYGYSLDHTEDEQKTFSADCIFIAVPTPFNWETNKYDGSIIESVLKKIEPGKIVVIKSTVKIGTTENLQEKFPELKILFNPEFLSEATATQDFRNPDRQIVGYSKKSYGVAIEVLNMLPESPYDVIMPSTESELCKFINNIHGSLSVLEANMYYDVCQNEGLDYERVKGAMEASKWVGAPMGRQYHTIWHKNKRGIGGHCFLKDVSTYIEYCKEKNIDPRILEAAMEYNHNLLNEQGLTENMAEKISTAEDVAKIRGY
jgi:UDPglucose 6-dehydrogenase